LLSGFSVVLAAALVALIGTQATGAELAPYQGKLVSVNPLHEEWYRCTYQIFDPDTRELVGFREKAVRKACPATAIFNR
jgi:hypothetical protein